MRQPLAALPKVAYSQARRPLAEQVRLLVAKAERQDESVWALQARGASRQLEPLSAWGPPASEQFWELQAQPTEAGALDGQLELQPELA